MKQESFMALASQNIKLLLGKPLYLAVYLSKQYETLQLLEVRSFADMISFIQVKKLLIYRSWKHCLLSSSYSKSDH